MGEAGMEELILVKAENPSVVLGEDNEISKFL